MTIEGGGSESANGVRVIWIDNTAKRNALDDLTRRALLQDIYDATESVDCAAIVLAGRGDTFCAGGELKSMPSDKEQVRKRMSELHQIIQLIMLGPKPVVAAVEGYAFGSGLSLLAACDHVIVSRDARLCCSFGNVGLLPDCGLIWTLPKRIGKGAATWLMLSAEIIDGVRAHEIGLADAIVESGTTMEGALQSASQLARTAPLAIAASKFLIGHPELSLDMLLEAEILEQTRLLGSADFNEGREAFFAGRPPNFRD